MKKQLFVGFAALMSLAMIGCEKTGTVEGTVMDAFTGEAIDMPSIWMDSTVFSTRKEKYPYKADLRVGKFKFDNVPVGSYKLTAGVNKYIKSVNRFTTTEENPNAELKIYIYSDKVRPGLYNAAEMVIPDTVAAEDARKIKNVWVIASTQCTESIAGYHLEYQQAGAAKAPAKDDKKAKKDAPKMAPLPDPLAVDAKLNVFYVNESSVTAPLVAKTFPAAEGNVADHSDCKGFDAKEKKGIFADKSNGKELSVEYVAENMFKITGELPKGKQIIQFSQDGKTLQTYYFDVK